MRRWTRLGIAAAVALAALVGAYSAYWWIVAAKIEAGAVAWRQAEAARRIDASWRTLHVSGYPLTFRVELEDAALRDRSWRPAPELRVARLIATARPWDFDNWRLAAPQGLSADLAAAGGRPALELAAQHAVGTALLAAPGATWLWLNLRDLTAEAGIRLASKSADLWITLPAAAPKTDTDKTLGLAVDLRQLQVPTPPVSFSGTVDRLALGVTLRGPVPAGPLAQAAAAWRDAGGTIDVDNLRLEWGGLGVSANGTVALDRTLQPMAAFSSDIEGFGAILKALVAADWLTEEQAALVRIALTSLSKPGPGGRPQITAPFTIQNGKMYLGPARLGPAPRIVWE